jgi:hypothetical protein
MTTKAGLLERLDKAVATWEELAEAALRADPARPGAMGDWSFVDVAGHLNGWRARSVGRREAAVSGTEPSRPWPEGFSDETEEGTDQINDWIHARYRDRPIDEILAEARDQWHRLRTAAEAIPEADLLTPGRYPWLKAYALGEVINGAAAHLHEEHEADIRSWLRDKPA